GRVELRGRDLEAPRGSARAGEQQERRGDGEWKRRRVEDVGVGAVARPAEELLGEEADRDHRELQVEPVVLEPEEQRDAEDDRERAEAERESPAVGPREQAVEAVGEQELGGDEG